MSWPLSCNSFMLLQNLCQALEMGTFCLMKDAGFHPVPFSCWRAVWQLGMSETYSGSWLNGTSDVKGTQRQPLNMSWGTAQFSLLWLWNKEEKQQRNLEEKQQRTLDVSSDEHSTLGLLENSVRSCSSSCSGKSNCLKRQIHMFSWYKSPIKKKKYCGYSDTPVPYIEL